MSLGPRHSPVAAFGQRCHNGWVLWHALGAGIIAAAHVGGTGRGALAWKRDARGRLNMGMRDVSAFLDVLRCLGINVGLLVALKERGIVMVLVVEIRLVPLLYVMLLRSLLLLLLLLLPLPVFPVMLII